MNFTDPTIQRLSSREKQVLDTIRQRWDMEPSRFRSRIDAWMANFRGRDKLLALQVLQRVDYYSERRFEDRLRSLLIPIERSLYESDRGRSDLIVLVPDSHGDSANHHAYKLLKLWQLPERQLCSLSQLPERLRTAARPLLVMFNDTHGTGRQFLRELWGTVELGAPREGRIPLFVVAVTIARQALDHFRHEFSRATRLDITIVPDVPAVAADEVFSAGQYRRLMELGRRVYRPHPMGFGNAGLLTAYHYQCPNNSLPIIWADGKNNAVGGLPGFPWHPLEPYRPKVRASSEPKVPAVPLVPERAEAEDGPATAGDIDWSAIEPIDRDVVGRALDRWRVDGAEWIGPLGRWLGNFSSADDREIARRLLEHTQYFDVERTRGSIRRLGRRVLESTRASGGTAGELVLVATGHHRPSVYHYLFDFLQEWQLEVDQVILLEDLRGYHALNKTLVFFYHTRRGDYFASRIWPTVLEKIGPQGGSRLMAQPSEPRPRVWDLPARRVCVASFAATPAARDSLNGLAADIDIEWERSASEVIDGIGLSAGQLDRLEVIHHELEGEEGDDASPVAGRLLTAYYFQCPAVSSPALWSGAATRLTNGRPWQPLFEHRPRR